MSIEFQWPVYGYWSQMSNAWPQTEDSGHLGENLHVSSVSSFFSSPPCDAKHGTIYSRDEPQDLLLVKQCRMERVPRRKTGEAVRPCWHYFKSCSGDNFCRSTLVPQMTELSVHCIVRDHFSVFTHWRCLLERAYSHAETHAFLKMHFSPLLSYSEQNPNHAKYANNPIISRTIIACLTNCILQLKQPARQPVCSIHL